MIKYEVKPVVCDYGIYENGELKIILNCMSNAKLIVNILNSDLKKKKIEDKSFLMICNKCGGSTIVSQKKIKPSQYKKIKFNNQKIRFGSSAMEETYMFCKCGNSVDDE